MVVNAHLSKIRAGSAVIAVIGLLLLGGCSSGTAKKASNTTSSRDLTSGSTTPSSGSGKALGDSCKLVSLEVVQTVLPAAPAGTSTGSTSTSSMCKYEVDSDHRLLIMVATGPADIMAKTKAGVAKLSGLTKVAGLGDVGYTSTSDNRLDVHFFRGDREVLISVYGQPDAGDALVSLGRKVDAAL